MLNIDLPPKNRGRSITFPEEHCRRIYSTNPLERLNKELERRTDVFGIFPDRASAYYAKITIEPDLLG